MFNADFRAQRGQALDVLVHRPLADGAAARQADAGFAEAGQQRAQHQDRRAHRLDQVVRRFQVVDLVGLQRDHAVCAALGPHAHARQQAQHRGRVIQVRHVGERERVGGQEAGA
ncbi:hypothetical protein D3C73_1238040 [compost metagenome]